MAQLVQDQKAMMMFKGQEQIKETILSYLLERQPGEYFITFYPPDRNSRRYVITFCLVDRHIHSDGKVTLGV